MAVGLTACGSSGPTATYAVHLSVDRPRTGANTFDIEVEGRKEARSPRSASNP